jgi:D-alanyl-D-alanine carboxypeptidase
MTTRKFYSGNKVEVKFDCDGTIEKEISHPQDSLIMPLASVSKWFIALAIGSLVEKGELQFNDSIERFLPSFPNAKKIKIIDLLRHTSGLSEIYDHPYFVQRVGSEYVSAMDVSQLLFEIASNADHSESAFAFNYSNSNYILLGEVVLKAVGVTLAQVVRTKVFAPLGMLTAQIGWSGEAKAFPTRSFLAEISGPTDFLEHECFKQLHFDEHFYDGNILVTSDDILAFFQAGCGQSLMSQKTWSALVDPGENDSNYACGIRVLRSSNGPVFWHTGFWLGFQTGLAFCTAGTRGLFSFDKCFDPNDPRAFARAFSSAVENELAMLSPA